MAGGVSFKDLIKVVIPKVEPRKVDFPGISRFIRWGMVL